MRDTSLVPGIALVALTLAISSPAQSPPNARLSLPETQGTATRVVQLMESTATAVPGLVRASDALRQNTAATVSALAKTPRDTSVTLQLVNEIRAYLALSDSLPRPEFFPGAASSQFLELRDELQKLDRHFQALLVQAQIEAHANDADPNNLKRYAEANSKSLAPTPSLPRFVFLGDAATDNWRLNEYFTGKDFVNRGIAGQTTNQILARFLADVVALRPMAVIVLAGSNDLAQGMTPSSIADNLVMMGDVAKAHEVQPIFASLLPVGGEAAQQRTPQAIQKVNTWIRDYCIRGNYIYLDYYTAMADEKGMMKADLSDDGVNPNARGYRVMSPLALDAVARLHDLVAAEEPGEAEAPADSFYKQMTPPPVFLTAMFLLNITPGPDMLYVLARATAQGRTAGLASALGIGAGGFSHIFAVAFGLAAVLRTLPLAYDAVRYAGAAYLIYLGVRTLAARDNRERRSAVSPASLPRIFMQGMITNVLNPKVAFFFLAFLPQFIRPQGSAFWQTVRLGLIFDASGTMVNVAVALAASSIGEVVRDRVGGVPVFRWLTGSIFIGLGLRLGLVSAHNGHFRQ